jgi:hypothetical protein
VRQLLTTSHAFRGRQAVAPAPPPPAARGVTAPARPAGLLADFANAPAAATSSPWRPWSSSPSPSSASPSVAHVLLLPLLVAMRNLARDRKLIIAAFI